MNERYDKYKESYKDYRKKNRIQIRLLCKKHYQENTDFYKEKNRKFNNDKKYKKEWIAKNKNKWLEYKRKHNAKRRSLGFVPLNSFFEGSEAHHINKKEVIFIPKSLHQSLYHNLETGENMEVINSLALNYLKKSK